MTTTRRGLDREAVVAAATALVDADGLEALSLARVAAELGIKPPSLYNHVEGLDSLRRDVALRATNALADRLASAAMGRSGPQALEAIALEVRSFAKAHPGLYELTAGARPEDAEYAAASMRSIEPVLAVLRAYDLEGDEAVHAARMLRAAIHGFVSLELVGGFGLDTDVDRSFEVLIERLAGSLGRPSEGI